jgi:hypothetical protein
MLQKLLPEKDIGFVDSILDIFPFLREFVV